MVRVDTGEALGQLRSSSISGLGKFAGAIHVIPWQPMMSSAVAELENQLQSMSALQPPGIKSSRVHNITRLCIANVQVFSLPFRILLWLNAGVAEPQLM